MTQNRLFNRIATALLVAVALITIPTAQAQNAGCTVDRMVINQAVQNGEIQSFVQIKKQIKLKRGDRVLRAELCMRPQGPVYALTIVNDNGMERRLDVNAVDGTIIR
ncbi:PepSY domain-containing protein [Maritalea mediterranea]|uniref:PepSY domain-containing protein n=1 Tax=Maritalea mediterranea TaxID=2909667 RepID=A0ABS9E500_9HYPH|nr:hypothetical protein [Maritalea mediterranea]MCF4097947.1 hypothetical protein [Maritalea mediterranea]